MYYYHYLYTNISQYIVFELLQNMFTTGQQPPLFVFCQIGNINLDITKLKKSRNTSDKLYKQQCAEIYNKSKNEDDLMNFLAAREINNDFPFLSYMVDSFSRDRVASMIKNGAAAEVVDWTKKQEPDHYLEELKKKR